MANKLHTFPHNKQTKKETKNKYIEKFCHLSLVSASGIFGKQGRYFKTLMYPISLQCKVIFNLALLWLYNQQLNQRLTAVTSTFLLLF